MTAFRSLLAGLIDYAGLFPPAALTMPQAVGRYDAHRRSRSAWALGRFVVPVARLAEFSEDAAPLLPSGPGAIPWRLSALLGHDPGSDLGEILAFNARHGRGEEGQARVDAVEVPVRAVAAVGTIAGLFEGFTIALEVDPRAQDFGDLIRAIRGAGCIAKLRTGGVSQEAVPPPDVVAAFIWACARHEVPFKLTAGLHHALRGEYPLTYAADSPRGVMHGLLNVLTAAAAARRMVQAAARPSAPQLQAQAPSAIVSILAERDPTAFEVSAEVLAWRTITLTDDEVEAARSELVLSVGSCSFEEPLGDLQTMGFTRPGRPPGEAGPVADATQGN